VAMKDRAQLALAEELCVELEAAGLEVLVDDRDERAGVKFKDADLLGCPIRIVIGQAYAKEGLIEIRERRSRREHRVPRDRVLETVGEAARNAAGG
jgi:prolyl-tRNA synthetase